MKCVGGHFSHESGRKGKAIAVTMKIAALGRGGAGFYYGHSFHVI